MNNLPVSQNSTTVRNCQGRRRPKQNVYAPRELSSLTCICQRYPTDITYQQGHTQITRKVNWGKCPRHAAFQLWNLISEYPTTVQWFRLWDGTRQDYKQYYNTTLRMHSDWIWIKQPSQRVVITPNPDVGGKKISREQLIALIKTSACCDERGSRFGRPKDAQRDMIRDICDISLKQLSPVNLVRQEDIDTLTLLSDVSFSWEELGKIARYGQFRGITWETAKSALKSALDLKKQLYNASTWAVEESWNVDHEPDTDSDYEAALQGTSWDTIPYVPKIRVPYSLAAWLAKRLPPHPNSDAAANRVWLDVKKVTEDYERAAWGLVQAQCKLPTSVLVTVQNLKEVIGEYIEKDKEVSNEEVNLKQKICAVLGAGDESNPPKTAESDLVLLD